MKSLVISDIHANLAALKAVLEAEGSWDEVLFLGDAVVGGPHPEEVLSILRGLDGVFVMGNHDREAIDIGVDAHFEDPNEQWIQWTRRRLSTENYEFLAGFRETAVLERDGLLLRLDHGVVSAELGKRVWPDSDASVFNWLSQRFAEECILIAHSHVQFENAVDGVRFLNVGTVGQPRLGQVVSTYAVLENGRVELRAVPACPGGSYISAATSGSFKCEGGATRLRIRTL